MYQYNYILCDKNIISYLILSNNGIYEGHLFVQVISSLKHYFN